MMRASVVALLVGGAVAGMPDCSTKTCPKTCSCVESKCGASMYSECSADSQCNTLINCMLKCSCGNVLCALGCVAGKTLDSVSEKVKSCASPCASSSERTVLYDRKVVPPTWNFVGRASSKHRMHFVIAVKQQNRDALEKKFWEVSDPKSKSWQQFMSQEEISKMVASKPEDMAVVKEWLSTLDKDARVHYSADGAEVRCSASDAEKLFETQIFIYVHDNGHMVLRSNGAHSVPAPVAAAIDFVEGIADFPMHRSQTNRHLKNPKQIATKTALVVPETLLEMYKVPAAKVSKVSEGPAEFQDDTSYNKQDLKTFFEQTDLPDETVSNIVGPYDGSTPDTEATLDVQYITSVGEKQVNWYWTADNWMYQWSNNFFNAKSVPDEVSISWGWAEDQQCTSGIGQSECTTLGIDSAQYVARVNTEFQKIGLRGVSLFVASGDSGANGRSDGECTDTVLHSSFPGSSPYVTAVGATMLQNPVFDLAKPPEACSAMGSSYACASGGVEVAVSSQEAGFTSGGGFSTYTPMPSYQKTAVEHYLTEEAKDLPPASYFNRSHRAYPDISAMGNNFMIYMDSYGGWQPVGGTSASTPTVAGVAAYLNDYSYTKTGKPLGFLNPLLYQMYADEPTAFTDVTIGDNKCTEDGCFASCKGYKCAKGWDPVSGLGTPVATKMLAYLEKQFEKRTASTVVV